MSSKRLKETNLTDIVLFRHGKAQRPHEANNDFDRNLTNSGKKQAKNQAQRLFDIGFRPDLVIVSSANRAIQTWEEAKEFFQDARVEITRNLYLASADFYLAEAIASKHEKVMIIAHDPGLHDLCRRFLKGNIVSTMSEYLRADFPTAGIAWFKADDNIKSKMMLISHLRPIAQPDI